MHSRGLLSLGVLCCALSAVAEPIPIRSYEQSADIEADTPISSVNDEVKADIRADTNRDGIVDITGISDIENKTTWTADQGAIFLPNIGDTDRRCSKALLSGPAVKNELLDACNDASDDILRSPQYLAPLRTVPMPDLPIDAVGRVRIKDVNQQKKVRIFAQRRVNGQWFYVSNNYTFDAAALREGLVLGIDGRDTRRPNGWDGRVTVSFEVQSAKNSSSDEVMLRVAPVLTHTHLDTVEQVFAVKANDTSSPWLNRFNEALKQTVRNSGLKEDIFLFPGSDDIWAQDFMEPGFASMPGPNGPVTLRVMIRSPQDERVAGRQLFEYYRDSGIGAVQQLGGARDEINSGGNIETIPPYEFNGTFWPAGRVILGNHGEQKHHLLPFFQAQETQDPLLLDTDWLGIGHVDEFVQFIPADSPRGWVMMVDDPLAGVAMLKKLKNDGHGSLNILSRKNDTESFPSCQDSFCDAIPVESTTIDQALADTKLMSIQQQCDERITGNIKILKQATGITDEEIIRLPALFKNSMPPFNITVPDDGLLKVAAFFPGVVNGLVMTGFNTYIAPRPWGPMVNGTDVLAETLKSRYAKVGMNVIYLDDWNTHHNFGGEIHCGTNSARNMDTEWY